MRFLRRLKGVTLRDRQRSEDKRNLFEVKKMTDDEEITGDVEMFCSPDARLQITKKSFQQQTSRKAGFMKTMNEMV
jgi:hypothetical protein